jgi:hypothetical protein
MHRRSQLLQRVTKRVVDLNDAHWEALRARAFEQHTSVSEQVRRAVARYLARKARR